MRLARRLCRIAERLAKGEITRPQFTTTWIGATPDEQTLLLNLAKTEHLRWNASHEMLGYRYAPAPQNPTKEEKEAFKELRDRLLVHNCLTTWEELDETTQSFDCAVADTSLKMYYKELQQKSE